MSSSNTAAAPPAATKGASWWWWSSPAATTPSAAPAATTSTPAAAATPSSTSTSDVPAASAVPPPVPVRPWASTAPALSAPPPVPARPGAASVAAAAAAPAGSAPSAPAATSSWLGTLTSALVAVAVETGKTISLLDVIQNGEELRRQSGVSPNPLLARAALCAQLANAVYPDVGGATALAAILGDAYTLTAVPKSEPAWYVAQNADNAAAPVFLIIPGTFTASDVAVDLRVTPVTRTFHVSARNRLADGSSSAAAAATPLEAHQLGVHSGFNERVQQHWPVLHPLLESIVAARRPLYLVGHSLGAACAQIVRLLLLDAFPRLNVTCEVFGFGSPLVFSRKQNTPNPMREEDFLSSKVHLFCHDADAVPRALALRTFEVTSEKWIYYPAAAYYHVTSGPASVRKLRAADVDVYVNNLPHHTVLGSLMAGGGLLASMSAAATVAFDHHLMSTYETLLLEAVRSPPAAESK